MLKIKDDVNLKELEKFGFDLRASSIPGIGTYDFTDRFVDDYFGQLIADDLYIWDSERTIYGNNLDLLYDLMEAGLVEKVGD